MIKSIDFWQCAQNPTDGKLDNVEPITAITGESIIMPLPSAIKLLVENKLEEFQFVEFALIINIIGEKSGIIESLFNHQTRLPISIYQIFPHHVADFSW